MLGGMIGRMGDTWRCGAACAIDCRTCVMLSTRACARLGFILVGLILESNSDDMWVSGV